MFGWENLLNKSGTTWRKLSVEEKEKITTKEAAFALMMEHNSLIKRPIIEDGKKYMIRFDAEEYRNELQQG